MEVPLRSPRAGVRTCDDQRSWQVPLRPKPWEALGSFVCSTEEHWPVHRPWAGCWGSGGQLDPSAPCPGTPSKQTRGTWKENGCFLTLLGSVGFGVSPAGPVLSLYLLLCPPGPAASPPPALARRL